MNLRTLRLLEYNKIVEMLTSYASSPLAKKKCKNIKPRKELARIETMQTETRDALIRINKCGHISFGSLRDIGPHIKLLEVKATLGIKELLDIASVLDMAKIAKEYGIANEAATLDSDCLNVRFVELNPLEHLAKELHRCIISETEIADDASSGLKSVRRSIKLTNEKLHNQLAKLVNNANMQSMFQDNLVTMRNGRYCIPVKQEYKNNFPGMIHDQSSSGATVFIEPMAVVNLNNQLKELANQEIMEIEKILEGLSAQVANEYEYLKFNFETLTELDFIFARAEFAYSYKGSEPIFNTAGIVDIKQGRHPLLEKHSVVPVDIRIGEDYNLLIVTGPNTGGKTVSLKTLGLFTLMGQSGLHIPALDGSHLNVFDDVFADIGDEQSIEQSLSTFSSHMSNIVYIVNHVTPNTLCLFDELGGGTDPVEGAALAISILSHLNNMGVRTMATTHYSELKTFAMTTPGVQNASQEFDVATLMPTYRLIIGIPGKSNAFAIASKLGLPEYIITNAKENMDSDTVDFESLLADMERTKREIDAEREETSRLKIEAEQLAARARTKDEDLSTRKAEILAKARAEAADLVSAAKEEADAAIRKYNKWAANPKSADASSMEAERQKLRENLKKYENTDVEERKTMKSEHKAGDFKVGDNVHVISMDSDGTVTAAADKKGLIKVQMGILSAMLPATDLLKTQDAEKNKQVIINNRRSMAKALNISPEVNVLGMTVLEATDFVDRYLDDAIMAHLTKVRIIHGKGTGALRKGIHEYLKKQKHIKGFHLAEYGEGDAGVTIVEL